MRSLIFSLLLLVFASLTGCDKSMETKTEEQTAGTDSKTVTATTKTGSWMTTYKENNVAIDMGLVMITFDGRGSVVADKQGTKYNGTYTETKTTTNHTFTINITTADQKLLKVNRKWKVTGITEYLIDCKDDNPENNATINFMKH